jgi:hypothetical protein
LYAVHRKAFRDAVAEAGTQPALATIADWIRSNKVEGQEAAALVAALPRAAITPTPEYLQAFFVSITKIKGNVKIFQKFQIRANTKT